MSTIEPERSKSQSESAPEFCPPLGGLIVYRTSQQELRCSGAGRPLMKAVNRDTQQVVLFHPRCKSWRCPSCALLNAQKAVFGAVYGSEVLSATNQINFLTVTSHEKLNAAGSWKVLPLAWNKLNRRIKREVENPQYFAVPEQHKNGRWHLHALTTARLPKKWWKDNARACGLGYQSDAQEARSLGGVAYYVSKYLGKSLQDSAFPKSAKRIRRSHGWPELPELPPLPGWQFMIVPRDVPVQHEVDSYQRQNFAVVMADEKSAWDWLKMWTETTEAARGGL